MGVTVKISIEKKNLFFFVFVFKLQTRPDGSFFLEGGDSKADSALFVLLKKKKKYAHPILKSGC